MTAPIRLLFVEDSPLDAEIVLRELRRGGLEPNFERVDSEGAMRAALDLNWDIVLSDWSMPQFSAMAALALLKERRLDIPFIVVSGTVGEEIAVNAMKMGAQDFFPKDRLVRLVPAVLRELREAQARRDGRKMHEQLMISERMASVGTLAAGLAHEINNPLAALIGNLEFAETDLALIDGELRRRAGADLVPLQEASARVRDALATIQEASERMRLVVRDLKIFSHPGDEHRRGPADVRGVLKSSLRMASNEIRHRARLIERYADTALVEGDESRLGQIFLNLIVNAAQAIPEGDAEANEITVTTRQLNPDQVAVEIADTGSGIPDHILPRIFDPFFTTKSAGVGTGLGLAICQRLVADLGGAISVTSNYGRGAVFTVVLPARRSDAEKRSAGAAGDTAEWIRAKILVVDDEPSLRQVVRTMLGKIHEVSEAPSGQEAFRIVTSGERFDVILCDLMMPAMTGMDLYGELDQSVPDQAGNMIFMTGGAFTDRAREFLAKVPNRSIDKPFKSAALRQLIQDVMAARL